MLTFRIAACIFVSCFLVDGVAFASIFGDVFHIGVEVVEFLERYVDGFLVRFRGAAPLRSVRRLHVEAHWAQVEVDGAMTGFKVKF